MDAPGVEGVFYEVTDVPVFIGHYLGSVIDQVNLGVHGVEHATDNINLAATGVALDERNYIQIDAICRSFMSPKPKVDVPRPIFWVRSIRKA